MHRKYKVCWRIFLSTHTCIPVCIHSSFHKIIIALDKIITNMSYLLLGQPSPQLSVSVQIHLDLLRAPSVSLVSRLRSAPCGGTLQRTMVVQPSLTMWWRKERRPGSLGQWSLPSVRRAPSTPQTSSRAMSTNSEFLPSTSLVWANHWIPILSLHRCNTVSTVTSS